MHAKFLQQQLDDTRFLLQQIAASGGTIGYRELAQLIEINQSPVIAQTCEILEKLMQEDVSNKLPIVAAVVVQKGDEKIPRKGFFEELQNLTVLPTDISWNEARTWHQNERKKLQHYYEENT